MIQANGSAETESQANERYLRGLARAFAGAIIFGFPLLMTMEMWWLGFYLDRARLLLFLILSFLLLIPLSYFVGFERTGSIAEDVRDSFVAFGVAILASLAMLTLFGVITIGMPLDEMIGKVGVQAAPASIGAILARGQLGSQRSDTDRKEQKAGYAGQLLIMTAGAVFLTFNVAPTEEMAVIAFMMTPWHALALILVSVALLHAFVFALGFSGQEEVPQGSSPRAALVSYSIAGYGIAILVSLYVLWTFGRTDGASPTEIASMAVVLGFPASLGAASARLII